MILDIILIVIFLGCVTRGWHKGGIASILKLLSIVISFALVFFFRDAITDIAMKTPLGNLVKGKVAGSANAYLTHPLFGGIIAQGAKNISRVVVMVVAMVISFFVLWFALSFVAKILTGVLGFLKLGVFNKTVGALFGAANGYICVYVTMLITMALSPIVSWIHGLTSSSSLINIIPSPLALFSLFSK
ncbi:CvpA family protein [Treponema sp. R6D11]